MERAELSELLRPWREGGEAVKGRERRVCITEAAPMRFMAALAAAVDTSREVFLCDPVWTEREQAKVGELLAASEAAPGDGTEQGWLMIPTGGSSGELKFARHDQDTLSSAVKGFQGAFGLERVNAVGLLPLHHVSGLMAWLRTVLTGGEYVHLIWKEIERQALPPLPDKPEGWVISLVPTQLDRLLRRAEAVQWLREFRLIFLGGGPAWPDLLDRAVQARLAVCPSYGMTETAAMVSALSPSELMVGVRSSGRPLPHVRIDVNEEGTIAVAGPSLFRGYYPEWRQEGERFETTDRGRWDVEGGLHVLGRRDGAIVSGGEKVHPSDVELVLRTAGYGQVVVLGMPDPEWGQMVVAAHPAGHDLHQDSLTRFLRTQLSPAKRPKRYVALETWPMSAAGKVNRSEVARLVARKLFPLEKR